MTNPISKGKNFERQARRILERFTRTGWHRVPNSGGLAHATGEERMYGDLYSKEYAYVVVECKACRKFTINDLFSTRSKLQKWILQASTQARDAELHTGKTRTWLLLFKVNNLGIYAVTPDHDLLDRMNISGKTVVRGSIRIRKVSI